MVIIKSYSFAWNQYSKGFYKNLLSPNDNIEYFLDYQPLKLVSTRLLDFTLGKFITTSTGEPAAYCIAACPAGEDVIAPFLSDRKAFIQEVVKPLQDKSETVYVVPGSDAESYVARRFPHKTVKRVSSGIRPQSIQGFLFGLPLLFQRNQSEGLSAIYHFTFTGSESRLATVTIQSKTVQVQEGHLGNANLSVLADSKTWLGFLGKEQNLIWALLRRKIRVSGSLKLLQAFGKCFPA